MIEWDKTKREPAAMEKWAEMLMGLAMMKIQREMTTRLAEAKELAETKILAKMRVLFL